MSRALTPKELQKECKLQIAEHRLRFEVGHFPALAQAVTVCATYRQPLEDWMVDELVAALGRAAWPEGRGQDSPKRLYGNDWRDYMRWRALESACWLTTGAPQKTRLFSPRRKAGKPLKEDADLRKWTMATARRLLKDIDLDCTVDQIQTSWERVQAAKDQGDDTRYQFPYLTNLPF